MACPVLPPGEDEAACVRHTKFLQAEEKKGQPNRQVGCR